ncbi:ETX/MTX2 family pore-forming toxin [Bacillus sp. BP-3]|uniref:ETX/MTX2 family pore-forming toxin n=1 Tax=Bacillus sp. BP-3 TaxID=3022773 RepID=UPI00232BE782|nr:ETX/MTX2 family pore-forming toxin [Bacillus sp. BP-3]MDC2867294.1 ETX/MTX2 family pore-forming toxin [Bacillus sp. BP-3]
MKKGQKLKKLLVVAPLACMLGTGIVTLPSTPAHAASSSYDPNTYREGTTYTKENMERAFLSRTRYGIENTPELRKKFKIADDEEIQWTGLSYLAPYQLSKQVTGFTVAANGTHFEVTPYIDSYEDLGITNLITINNDDGIEKQTAVTPEVTEKYVETNTYTNQEGFKIGLESATTWKVSIPFDLGEVSQSIKLNTEFNYSHTDTNTSSHEKTVTYKSQSVVAAPGGTTTYYGTTKKAKFSGSFQTDAYVTGGLTLTMPIVKKGNLNKVVHTETVTLTSEDIYNIFKNNGVVPGIPPYLKLDDVNKKLLINNATFNYSGEGGYYSAIQVKFTPKDRSQTPQKMSYKEYKEKVQDGTLSK